jgi:hypothetical protein
VGTLRGHCDGRRVSHAPADTCRALKRDFYGAGGRRPPDTSLAFETLLDSMRDARRYYWCGPAGDDSTATLFAGAALYELRAGQRLEAANEPYYHVGSAGSGTAFHQEDGSWCYRTRIHLGLRTPRCQTCRLASLPIQPIGPPPRPYDNAVLPAEKRDQLPGRLRGSRRTCSYKAGAVSLRAESHQLRVAVDNFTLPSDSLFSRRACAECGLYGLGAELISQVDVADDIPSSPKRAGCTLEASGPAKRRRSTRVTPEPDSERADDRTSVAGEGEEDVVVCDGDDDDAALSVDADTEGGAGPDEADDRTSVAGEVGESRAGEGRDYIAVCGGSDSASSADADTKGSAEAGKTSFPPSAISLDDSGAGSPAASAQGQCSRRRTEKSAAT